MQLFLLAFKNFFQIQLSVHGRLYYLQKFETLKIYAFTKLISHSLFDSLDCDVLNLFVEVHVESEYHTVTLSSAYNHDVVKSDEFIFKGFIETVFKTLGNIQPEKVGFLFKHGNGVAV